MKTLLAILTTIIVAGLASSIHATQSVGDQWSGSYHNDAAYIFNPNNHTITNVDPAKNFTIERTGNWDIVRPAQLVNEYLVNGERTYLPEENHITINLWIDDQISKIWKWIKLHTTQITDLQDDTDKLNAKIGKQGKRITALEVEIKSLQDTNKDLQKQINALKPTSNPDNTPS